MTIDEAINTHKLQSNESIKYNDRRGVFYDAKEHEQLAEWLEEYKRVKNWKDEVMEEFCRYDASSFEELMQRARNKAIGDYVERLKETFKPCKDSDNYIYTNVCRRFDEIAQQLKEGGIDGNSTTDN